MNHDHSAPTISSHVAPTPQNSNASQDIVLEAKKLTRHYYVRQGLFKKPAVVRALNEVDFSLKRASTLGIVGESGCGKSTLARVLTMVDHATSGTLIINNHDVTHVSGRDLKAMRSSVQMVFQNPYASLNPRKTIAQTLLEPLIVNTKLTRQERRERMFEMMRMVGLRPEFAQRYPHMFSGGQRQRVAIARAMILDPQILIADEPVSALDVSIQAQILNLFLDLQERLGTSYIFISHNLSVVRYIAQDLLVMYLGSIAEYGSKDVIYKKPMHPYTRALMAATPEISVHKRKEKTKLIGELPSPLAVPSGCPFRTRCPYAIERCEREFPALRNIENRSVACHRAEDVAQEAP